MLLASISKIIIAKKNVTSINHHFKIYTYYKEVYLVSFELVIYVFTFYTESDISYRPDNSDEDNEDETDEFSKDIHFIKRKKRG